MISRIRIFIRSLFLRFINAVASLKTVTFDCTLIPFYSPGFCLGIILHIPFGFVGIAGAHTLPVSSNTSALDGATGNVVVGIISYITWPKPPSPFRLCIVGQTEHANGPFLDGTKIDTSRILTQHETIDNSQLGSDCDVVYSGAMTQSNRGILQAELTGHPVVTIAEQDKTCSDGSMFCLVFHGTDVAFSVNLDSVARSGVEVDPRVLLLGRWHKVPQ
jgi:hypothetical protein